MTIQDIQRQLLEKAKTAPPRIVATNIQEVNYALMDLRELQERYNKLEAWCYAHTTDERLSTATERLKRINKYIMAKTKV